MREANWSEAFYPMMNRSRFFTRVYGFGFCLEDKRALFVTEYVDGAPTVSSDHSLPKARANLPAENM